MLSHPHFYRKEREAYYERRASAVDNPREITSLIIDGEYCSWELNHILVIGLVIGHRQ